jgi:PqqD family protein of HPr-rel-A system
MNTTETTATWRRDPGLPYQQLDEETIVVDPARREVHLLNATAARVWELCETPRSLEDLVSELAEEYEAPEDELRTSVAELLAVLGERRLVIAA